MQEAPSLLNHTPETDLIYYLQDIWQFSQTAAVNSRMFTHIVFSTFGAIQAGMIITRGSGWVKTPHRELKEGQKPRAKPFICLFEELKDKESWEGYTAIGLSQSSRWDSGIRAIKDMRDALEHPKYDGTHMSILCINNDCLDGLDYLRYIISESPRIQDRFGDRHSELKQLHEIATNALSAIQVNQTDRICMFDMPDMPDEMIEAQKKAAHNRGEIPIIYQNGLIHRMQIVPIGA